MKEERCSSSVYAARLLGTLHDMRASQQLTDLSIMIGDEQTVFNVHKCVMVAASKHFAALVHADQLSDSHCLIRGVEEEHWTTLLNFIYTGVLDLTVDNYLTLHSTAQQLGIKEAEILCEEYMTRYNLPTEEEAYVKEGEFDSAAEENIFDGPENKPTDEIDIDIKTEKTDGFDDGEINDVIDIQPEVDKTMETKPGTSQMKETMYTVSMPTTRSMRTRQTALDVDDEDTDDAPMDDEDFDPDFAPSGGGDISKRKRNDDIALSEENSSNVQTQDEILTTEPPKKKRYATRDTSYSDSLDPAVKKLVMRGYAKTASKKDSTDDNYTPGSTLKRPYKRISNVFKTKRANFKFTKYGRLIDVWQDDNSSDRPLPQFKCKRCQFRFFYAASLALHSLHKHCMPLTNVQHGKVMRKVRLIQWSKSVVAKRGTMFRCKVCAKNFKSRSMAISHVQLKHDNHRIRCTRCNALLTPGARNMEHRCSGAKSGPRVPNVRFCRHCPRQFRHSKVAERHYLEEHPDENFEVDMMFDVGYSCRHCKRTFVRLAAYLVHLFGHGLSDREVDLEFSDPAQVPIRCEVRPDPGHTTLPYKCPDCEFRFDSSQTLGLHMISKHHKRVTQHPLQRQYQKFPCEEDDCSLVFNRIVDLRQHVTEAHKYANYSCSKCNYSTNIRSKYEGHNRLRHSVYQDINNCPHCGKQFDKKQRLKIHMVSAHGVQDPTVKVFKCPVPECDYTAYTRHCLIIHRRKHVTSKDFKCEHCGKAFKSERGVKKHVDNIHLNIRPFICETCGASYATETELKKHITRHGDTKAFQCTLCDYSTHEKGNFQSHLYTRHTVVLSERTRIYFCDHCSYSTTLKRRYNQHITSHAKRRGHICEICQKGYMTQSSLASHMKLVHSAHSRILMCSYCNYETPSRQSLTNHVRAVHTHKDVRPYGCPYCAYTCKTSGNTRLHIKQKHPGRELDVIKLKHISTKEVHDRMEIETGSTIPPSLGKRDKIFKAMYHRK